MTLRRLSLAALPLFAVACAPQTGGIPGDDPTGDQRPAAGAVELHCATAAVSIDFDYTAVRVLSDADGDAVLTVGAAHPDSEGVLAAPAESHELALSVDLTNGLDLVGDGLTISADDIGLFPNMWIGTLSWADLEADVTCWHSDFEGEFAYDPTAGECRNGEGTQGWNSYPVPYVRETGDAQCGIFWALSLNEDNLGYPLFTGMDLRGAQLGGASFHFANMQDARLEGADLTGFEYGYAQIEGSVDAYTQLPPQGCERDGDAITCRR